MLSLPGRTDAAIPLTQHHLGAAQTPSNASVGVPPAEQNAMAPAPHGIFTTRYLPLSNILARPLQRAHLMRHASAVDLEQRHEVGGDGGMFLFGTTALACGVAGFTAVSVVGLMAGIELLLTKPSTPFNPSGQQELGKGITLIVLTGVGVIPAGGFAAGALIGMALGACCLCC